MLSIEVKKELVEKFGKNSKDTGNAEVQTALLTEKINQLSNHLKSNKKDYNSQRSIQKMVGARKKFLKYVYSRDVLKYRELISKLNIRDTIK